MQESQILFWSHVLLLKSTWTCEVINNGSVWLNFKCMANSIKWKGSVQPAIMNALWYHDKLIKAWAKSAYIQSHCFIHAYERLITIMEAAESQHPRSHSNIICQELCKSRVYAEDWFSFSWMSPGQRFFHNIFTLWLCPWIRC